MKTTVIDALDNLLYNSIVETKESIHSFIENKQQFYNKDVPVSIKLAINLKNSKNKFDKAVLELYNVLATKRTIEKLKNEGVEV